jgi:hypothetical protein
LAELAAADAADPSGAPDWSSASDASDGSARPLAVHRPHGPAAASGAPAPASFAARLAAWLDWTDAVALSAALNAGLAEPPAAEPQDAAAPGVGDLASACARVRQELGQLATAGVNFAAEAAKPQASPASDFSPCRRDYLAHQRAMDASIGTLRAQVRADLASRSPALRQLAALDAAMDQALRPRERHLLARVPVLLQAHFEHLHRQPAQGSRDRYNQDMQSVLLAELDLRFEPIDGMLEALRCETDR